MKANFSVPGKPVAKGRPRLGKHGKFYTPTAKEEKRLASDLLVYARCAGFHETKRDVRLKLVFCGSRGDIDNLIKHFMDAANGILWVDDRQVVDVHATVADGDPRTHVEVEEL